MIAVAARLQRVCSAFAVHLQTRFAARLRCDVSSTPRLGADCRTHTHMGRRGHSRTATQPQDKRRAKKNNQRDTTRTHARTHALNGDKAVEWRANVRRRTYTHTHTHHDTYNHVHTHAHHYTYNHVHAHAHHTTYRQYFGLALVEIKMQSSIPVPSYECPQRTGKWRKRQRGVT